MGCWQLADHCFCAPAGMPQLPRCMQFMLFCVAATSAPPASLHAPSGTDPQQPDPDTAVLQTLNPLLNQPCALLLCFSPARACLAAGASSWSSVAWLQPRRAQQQRSSVLPSAQPCSVWCEAAFCCFS